MILELTYRTSGATNSGEGFAAHPTRWFTQAFPAITDTAFEGTVRRYFWSFLLIPLALLLGLPNTTDAQPSEQQWAIECKGTIEKFMTMDFDSNREQKITHIEFEWYMDSLGRWANEATHTGPDDSTATVITASNGENVYHVNYSGEVLTKGADGKLESRPSQDATGVIADRIQDLDGANFTYFLWLAFLGAREASPGEEREQLLPLMGFGSPLGRMESYGYSVEADRVSDGSMIAEAAWSVDPERMSYRRLARRPGVPIPSRSPSEVRERLETLRKAGEQVAVSDRYQLEETARVGSHVIPLRATAEHFSADYDGRRVARMTLNVTDYELAEPRGAVLPRLSSLGIDTMWVEDIRFRTKSNGRYRNRLKYGVTDGTWPVSTNDPRAKEALEEARPMAQVPGQSRRMPGTVAVVGLAGLLLLPLIVIAFRRLTRMKGN